MKRLILAMLMGSMFLIDSPPATAGVITSTFGPGDSFDAGTGWIVDASQDMAMPFTVSGGSNFTFTSVELALSGSLGTLNILLMSDAAGLPGGVIESITVTDPAGITTATSTAFPTLVAGTTYWIATQYLTDGYDGGWNLNDQGFIGPEASTLDSGASWIPFDNTLSAFRVNGDTIAAVPEPGSLTLLGVGRVSLGGMAWRKRRIAA